MIISTPQNPYCANAQSPNRSTGACAPEFTVCVSGHNVLCIFVTEFEKSDFIVQ